MHRKHRKEIEKGRKEREDTERDCFGVVENAASLFSS